MWRGQSQFAPFHTVGWQTPNKKNIKALIAQEKKNIQENKKKFEELVRKDIELTRMIIDTSQQSHLIWHDLQDINQGRITSTRLRNLKTEINEVLNDAVQTGTITDLPALANLRHPELDTFLELLETHRNGFRNNFIEKIPFFLYQTKEENEKDDMCSICHENYVEKDQCVNLMCNHLFHRKCITTWLKMKKFCPMCKQEVKPLIVPNSSTGNNPPPSQNNQNLRENPV